MTQITIWSYKEETESIAHNSSQNNFSDYQMWGLDTVDRNKKNYRIGLGVHAQAELAKIAQIKEENKELAALIKL